MNKYWLQDTTGKIHIYEAENDVEARHYFYASGDHAHDYGRADKEFFKKRLADESLRQRKE